MSRGVTRETTAWRRCWLARVSRSRRSWNDVALIPRRCARSSPDAEGLSAADLPTRGRTRTRSNSAQRRSRSRKRSVPFFVLLRQRIRSKLEVQDLARRALSAFHVERRSRAYG